MKHNNGDAYEEISKTQCRLTIPTQGKNWKLMKWTDFLTKYYADPAQAGFLKQSSGSDWKNWYVCEEAISLSDVSVIECRQADGSYAPKE